ncbi:hypothetical protein TPHA_0J03090 [Tetrapisispora phaffii CBS 4417]|uniref:Methionine--tRNA ligase, mitochondrial n=1 Tax=Tetrapisispora phaffii (strain ATCC 24235 / CBS 4417 / NBRC 1672 / NRRL Y-8282 / UCD 70-5) TaxID=1071381 RepID=G8BY78_TETPH|nr:hypothetical protein TPHA_0J03090 [Tetrapisispora phaffii CBS 4417]CCE65129.1 hypothetical protein TPHA_0J03090 [Tetrapisispora phaffii CBS 4417]
MRLNRLRRLSTRVAHVTSPIYYPNAKPHLGHLYSNLLCDVTHKWKTLNKTQSLFTTGTDEHGFKIQNASEKNGYKDPKLFVNTLYKEFVLLNEKGKINYTRFIRTTDEDHIESVKKLWELCWNNGFIYKGEHVGWYSISDETFYPESKVIKDPKSPDKYINTESYNEVSYHSEINYFFKLTAFRERLIEYINNNPAFIYPESKKDQILNELKNSNNIQDLSVSRPATRLHWGITVPNDPDQKIYVWFDALCNYITSIGGIDKLKNDELATDLLHQPANKDCTVHPSKTWWINTTHVIGKDIMKFHAIYWPSFLMAAGLPLNKQIIIHSHWLCNGVKMSKSLGNVVDPIEMIDYYGADTLRWFLLENSQLEEDGNFQEEKLYEAREMFVSKWGNLINRCCGKKFNISRAVSDITSKQNPEKYIKGQFLNDVDIVRQIDSIFEKLNKLPQIMDDKLQKYDTSSLLREIWGILFDANTLMQHSAPWKMTPTQQDCIIFICTETTRILSILCQPIIHSFCNKFLDKLEISKDRRSIDYIKFASDKSYGLNSNLSQKGVPIERVPKRQL